MQNRSKLCFHTIKFLTNIFYVDKHAEVVIYYNHNSASKEVRKTEIQLRKKEESIILISDIHFLARKTPACLAHTSEILQGFEFSRYTDFPSIWLCISGSFTLYTESENFFCSPGSVVIMPPGIMHYPDITGDNPPSVMRISTVYDAYKDVDHATYINSITHLHLAAFSKELGFSPVRSVMLSPSSFEKTKKLLSSPSLKSIEKFFSLPEFNLCEDQKAAALSVIFSRLLPVLTAMTYVQKNYPRKISADNLAKASGICRTNIFIFFKKYLGISPSMYIVTTRVIRAQYAIAHTQYSLQYISDMCGFATISHMTNCYKRYKGALPKDDRAKMKIFRKMFPNIHVSHDYFSTDGQNKKNEVV